MQFFILIVLYSKLVLSMTTNGQICNSARMTMNKLNQPCLSNSDCDQFTSCSNVNNKHVCKCKNQYYEQDKGCYRKYSGRLNGTCNATVDCKEMANGDCLPDKHNRQSQTCQCKSNNMVIRDYKCTTVCKANEVSIDGECRKRSGVGQDCISSLQCQTAFSYCNAESKCACFPGFAKNNQVCEPQSHRCTHGKPLQDEMTQVPVKCFRALGSDVHNHDNHVRRYSISFPSAAILTDMTPYSNRANFAGQMQTDIVDSCPNHYYCEPNDSAPPQYHTHQYGHCCPMPLASCPIGEPLILKETCQNGCPDTHYCNTLFLNGYNEIHVCCPLACSPSQILHEDQCYPKLEHTDPCLVDAQCQHRDINSVCEDGVCQCNSTHENKDGLCRPKCLEGTEIMNFYTNECLPIVGYGECCEVMAQCQNDGPQNLHCDRMEGKCKCQENYIAIDGRCIIEGQNGICAQDKIYVGPKSNVTCVPKIECPPYTSVIKYPLNYSIQNQTGLCQFRGHENDYVDSTIPRDCEDNNVCTQFTNWVGVCCPKAEKLCPNNGRDLGNCNSDLECVGENTRCHIIMKPANAEKDKNGICCSTTDELLD